MIRPPARRWIVLLALAGSGLTASPAIDQTSVPMEFPPPGTRWINRSVDQTGGVRASDNGGVQFFERASRNWFATVVREKERAGVTPHPGSFAWPLEVGTSWNAAWAAFGLTGVGR